MGRHEAAPSILEDIVADYARQRARTLVAQFDARQPTVDWATWIGAAAEILRELTRDA